MFPDQSTVPTAEGLVDLVAVWRWIRGDAVDLTDAELIVAYHACADGAEGRNANWFQRHARISNTTLKARYRDSKPPVDRRDGSRISLIPTRKAG